MTGNLHFTVLFYIDGVLVDSGEAYGPPLFSDATLLLGHATSSGTGSTGYFDDCHVIRDSVDLIGNAGFESALLGASGVDPAIGNFRPYESPGGRTSAVAQAGSWSGLITTPGGAMAQNRYYFQDISLATGETFDLDFYLRPESGDELIQAALLFDWDRDSSTAGTVDVIVEPDGVTWQAWGAGGVVAPVSYGEFHRFVLRIITSGEA